MRVAGVGYLWNTATANSTILCQSCHDMHFSNTNHGTSATGSYLMAFQCAECHTSGLGSFPAGVHHVSGIAAANTLANGAAVISTATDWSARSQTQTAVNYWALSTTMDCKTCHGIGNAGAHNNANNFPGIAGIMTESDMCVDCHGFNPSVETVHSTYGTATHFVGPITDTAYKLTTTMVATYTDNTPLYSPDGANGSQICYSCHTVRVNGKNGHLVSYQFSNNVGDGLAGTKDSIRNLLLVSGNSDTYTAAADNLCTACHGATPGGGQSHPVLPNFSGTSTMAPTGYATTVSGQAVGQINCESCHRPHDADTDTDTWTNAWILEAAANPGTYIDYSPVCDNCHPGQY
jgi:predicted CXXCH cytochrome family protein